MQLRPAISTDKSAIINLLRESLGESTIPKSEHLWNWKHEQNPFGPSYVLVAEENETIVGLRAFMLWEWKWKGEIYKTIRAVDTATHPDYQGKGIFKKLTLHQISICQQQGISFVFNTPNTQSKPGYLKMGWVEQGRLPLKFTALRPFTVISRKVFKTKSRLDVDHDNGLPNTLSSDIVDLITDEFIKSDHLKTHLSAKYISWRYLNNPLFRYIYFTDKTNYLLICRIKTHPFARELRLVEFILLNPSPDFKTANRDISKQVFKFCKVNKIDFIAMSALQYSQHKSYFKWMGMAPVLNVGPAITLKDLNMKEKFPEFLTMKNWEYSLGDLELF